jgi:hypothetical protein
VAGAVGRLEHTSGVANLGGGSGGGWTFVGAGGATGTYNLSGTAVLNTGRMIIGDTTTAGSNGTVNVSGDAQINVGLGPGEELWVGQLSGATGELNISSGNVDVDGWIAVGRDNGNGTVNLTGTGRLAKVSNGPSGDSEITTGGLGTTGGGTINVQDDAVLFSNTGIVLGESAGRFGIVNQSGGTVEITNEIRSGAGTGTYNLSGGSLIAARIGGAAAPGTPFAGTLDWTGGTLTVGLYEGSLTQGGGTLAPGGSPGTTTIMGNYSLNSGDLAIELEGTDPGTGYDQVVVTGDVSLAGGLSLSTTLLASQITLGQTFTIIDNQGANPVGGTLFTGLGEGATVSAGGLPFSISYIGGSGNDVVLTSLIPEPTSITLLAFAVLGTFGIARRRR